MSSLVDEISSSVRKRYELDDYFYPEISMDLDIPNGFKGEITDIIENLEKNRFQVSSENVFRIMELKKTLLKTYFETTEGKDQTARYRKLMLEDIKPTGITLPIELVLVNGLVALALYVLARFTGSFADEAGKIMARKLLEKDKQRSKELNIDIREYRFLKNEVTILIEDGKILNSLKEQVKEKE